MRKIILGILVLALFVTIVPVAEANTIRITIRNNTGYTITHLYVNTENFSGTPRDLLGNRVLRPGESQSLFDVRLNQRYRVRARDTDGDIYSFIIQPTQNNQTWPIEMRHMHRG